MFKIKKKILIITIIIFCFSISIIPSLNGASGISIYGTLYIDGEIAESGVLIKVMDEEELIDQTTTQEWNQDNYLISLGPTYEDTTIYFFVGEEDYVPVDNASFYVGSETGYRVNLSVIINAEEENNTTVLKGDINLDDVIDVFDVYLLGSYVFYDYSIDPEADGDMNDDQVIDVFDVYLLGTQVFYPDSY